uniref:Uncharacterized protein n=1 Tax=Ananas comosus var. bracteatus TaxID=296719 RepID=A0A6V7PHA3_ANACO|nr:unnamed protein product [Ananas comosus var. bracteatus]
MIFLHQIIINQVRVIKEDKYSKKIVIILSVSTVKASLPFADFGRPPASSCSGDAAGDTGLVPGAVRGGAGSAEFLSLSDLHRLPTFSRPVTTLFQTTGRAPFDLGAVNLTSLNSSSAILVRSPTPFSPSPANSNATVLGLVASLPYNVSVFAIDALLVPYGFDLAASEIRPPRRRQHHAGAHRGTQVQRRRVHARAPAEKRGGDAKGA